ncbi:MAG: pyridoxamine 5'-phosphate oxidase family protein [Sandaracinobacteroides sp.]
MPSLSRAESGIREADPAGAASRAWELLALGARDRQAPWRTPVLATAGLDGAPRARILVLRGVDPAAAMLWLHSDGRAGKIADMAAEPRVALVFWDPARQLQLRVEGEALLETDPGRLDASWARVPPDARRNYASADPPGAVLGAGGLLGDGRANFALVEVRARRLEWLWLGAARHVRGESRLEPGGWADRALQP